jgi:hypothetical protein
MRSRAPRAALLVLASTLALAACGGDDGAGGEDRQTATPQQAAPLSPVPQGAGDLPARIPLKGTGPGDPAAIKVIRLWSDALRLGDVKAASALWAVPSKVQNGTPVIALASSDDVRTFNGSLSCGSQLVSGLGAKGSAFIVAEFKLTKRRGADCGTGTGQRARTAILVRDGKIAEWYRLPDDPDAPAPDGPATSRPPAGPVV